jgi:hypothetical protein
MTLWRGTHRAGHRLVPRQRATDQVVVAVVRPDEHWGGVVRLAARAAHEQDVPLDIALVDAVGASTAHNMAVMDEAIATARAASPGAEIRVAGPFGPDSSSTLQTLRDVLIRFVVCTQETWDALRDVPDLTWLHEQRSTIV